MSVSILYTAATIEHMSRLTALSAAGVSQDVIDGLTDSFNRTCALAERRHAGAYAKGYMDGEQDPMTRMPRRGGLKIQFEAQDHRKHQNPNGKNYALIFDVKNLKPINDNRYLGSAVGDNVITAMANIIKSVTRNGDPCARIGGDEFVLLLMKTDDDFVRLEMPRRIIEAHQKMGCVPSPIGPLPFDFRYTTVELPDGATYDEIIGLLDPKKDASIRDIVHAHRELSEFQPFK